MTRRITLIRHAETEANVAGGWQGQSDSDLTSRGRAQVGLLATRLGTPDLLVASDLERTALTAQAIGAAEQDPMWREFDFGAWDGLRPDEIERRFPGQLEAMRSGEDFAPEGGERISEFATRIHAAFGGVASRLEDGEEAIVVTHGGVIHGLVVGMIGAADRGALALPANTSLTTIMLDGDYRPQVYTFNDVSHLDGNVAETRGRSVLLYRHAQTVANREHRWHGRSETPLTDIGRQQAADLGASAVPLDLIAASPLSRARETAEAVGAAQGSPVSVVDGLAEIHFGEWEGMTSEEIKEADPRGYGRIFEAGEDAARGASGETFSGAGSRLASTVDEIAATTEAGTIGLFTHGGVARAYVAGMLGVPFADRHALPVLRNTAHAEVTIEPGRTRLASYNVAPHLEN